MRPSPHWPASYEIRVAEQLEGRWQQWFLDLEFVPTVDQSGSGTLLRGVARDQPSLFGVLARVRDLNLTLLEVRRVGDASKPLIDS